jgi:hypothetical protein
MLWVAWRQHRAQAIGAAAVAVVIAVYAVTVGFVIRDAAADNGLADCLAEGGACNLLAMELLRRFDRTVGLLTFSIWLPLLVGAFFGAPLVARELERGTHLLAWTQGVTRGRWLLTRVAVAAAGIVVSMTVLAAGIGWLHGEYYGLSGLPMGLSTSRFDLHDVTPAALALATFGIGVMAGVLLRRTLLAMAISMALGFGLVQLISWLREDLIEPVRRAAPYGEAAARPSDLVVAEGFLDRSGNEVTAEELERLCGGLLTPGEDVADPTEQMERYGECLHDAGIQTFALVHPDDRYWMLQGLNAAMFLAAGILALAVAYWATVRRTR